MPSITAGYGEIWAKAPIPLYQKVGNALKLVHTVPAGMKAGTGVTVVTFFNPATKKGEDLMVIKDYDNRTYVTPTRYIDKAILLGTGAAKTEKKPIIPLPVKQPGTGRNILPGAAASAAAAAAAAAAGRNASPFPSANGDVNKPGVLPMDAGSWTKGFNPGKWPWYYWAIGTVVLVAVIKK